LCCGDIWPNAGIAANAIEAINARTAVMTAAQ
jgi:hypothetical protein